MYTCDGDTIFHENDDDGDRAGLESIEDDEERRKQERM